jgi:hypothetical protein
MKQLGLASHLFATDNEKLNQYEAPCSPETEIACLRTALVRSA